MTLLYYFDPTASRFIGGALMTCLSNLWNFRYPGSFLALGFFSSTVLSLLFGSSISITLSPAHRSGACRLWSRAPFGTVNTPSGPPSVLNLPGGLLLEAVRESPPASRRWASRPRERQPVNPRSWELSLHALLRMFF